MTARDARPGGPVFGGSGCPQRPGTALAWYFHLPWVMDDADVLDLVRESLDPMLAVHARTGAPVTLAITGVLLARLARIAPRTVARLRELADGGIVDIAATFHHEVYPFLLEPRRLAAHVSADLRCKTGLFGKRPVTFFPANFAWTPALAEVLGSAGIRHVILDGRHLGLAGAMPAWKWHEDGPVAPLHPAVLPPTAVHRAWTLRRSRGAPLTLLFRDVPAVHDFSFGDEGGIHHALDEGALERAGRAIDRPARGMRLLADDGDRVNAVSVDAYAGLVAEQLQHLRQLAQVAEAPPGTMDHLAGFTLGRLDAFWLSAPESHHWLRVLDAIHRDRPDPADPEVMALHDVFPLFWRTHWRVRRFWEEAWRILETAGTP